MPGPLESIRDQLPPGTGRSSAPPLHLWNPPLSGDIDIVIERDGRWLHDGRPFRREAIVRLFASILRREADGEYYLVTPVEKWKIRVELHPLIAEDVDVVSHSPQQLRITCATGLAVDIGAGHPIGLEAATGNTAYVELAHGLTALLSRKAWERLVALARQEDGAYWVDSGGERFYLGSVLP